METHRYWAKSVSIEAVRITPENMRELEYETEVIYFVQPNGETPYLLCRGGRYVPGDWVVVKGDFTNCYTHEDFSKKYWTHSEHMAEDEKYARIYQLVRGAMNKQDIATFNGGDNVGMDFIAEDTTQRILRAL